MLISMEEKELKLKQAIHDAYNAMLGSKTPREFQLETLFNLSKIRSDSENRAYIVVATGGGKTTVAVMDLLMFADNYYKHHGTFPKILWLAHRKELLDQATEDLVQSNSNLDEVSELDNQRETLIEAEINSEEQIAGLSIPVIRDPGLYNNSDSQGILVTSVQKMYNQKDSFAKDSFDYIVIDEAHHAYARTYQEILEHFDGAFQLGLTATPYRFSDRRDVGDYFLNKAMDKNLVDLVNTGLLTTHYFNLVKTNITLEDVNMNGPEYALPALWKRIKASCRNDVIVDTFLSFSKQTGHYARLGNSNLDLEKKAKAPTLVFAINQEHAKTLAQAFQEKGVLADYLIGSANAKTRTQKIEDFKNGKIQVLVTVDILNEGFDFPPIELILMTRPTRCKTIYLQQLGRGSRLSPLTNKSSVLIIDFVDNMSAYQQAVNHRTIFRKKHDLDEKKVKTEKTSSEKISNAEIKGSIEIESIVSIDMAEIFGGYRQILENEAVVAMNDQTLSTIPGKTQKNAQQLNSLLGVPTSWDEEVRAFTRNGVTVDFIHRKHGSKDIWAFDKDKIEDVMSILDIDGFAKQTQLSQEDEAVVAVNDQTLSTIPGNTQRIAQQLNSLLGKPTCWHEEIRSFTKNGVTVDFIHRKKAAHDIWAFKKDKTNEIMAILAIAGFAKPTLPLQADEAVVSVHDQVLSTIPGSIKNFALHLNSLLGKPSCWNDEIRTYTKNGVSVDFYHRKHGGQDIWVFKKDKLKEVMSILSIYGFAKQTKLPQADEAVVSGSDQVMATIPGTTINIAKQLNSLLGAPSAWDEEVRSFTRNGVTVDFIHRKSGMHHIWVFKKDKLKEVKQLLGLPS